MKNKDKINNIIAVCIMALTVCFVYVSCTTFIAIPPKQVVTSAAEIKRELNRDYAGLGSFRFVHASDNLIILNDANYVVILEQSENIWSVTALVNPYNNLIVVQGSYYSNINIDTTLRYLMFTSAAQEGPKTYHAAYLVDTETLKISTYPQGELPKDIVPFSRENSDTSPDGQWSFSRGESDNDIILHNNLTEKTKTAIFPGDIEGGPLFYSNSEILYLRLTKVGNKYSPLHLLKDYLLVLYNIETRKFASIDIKY